jgi:hypothetical protein
MYIYLSERLLLYVTLNISQLFPLHDPKTTIIITQIIVLIRFKMNLNWKQKRNKFCKYEIMSQF